MRYTSCSTEAGFDNLIARHGLAETSEDRQPSVQDQLRDAGVPDEAIVTAMEIIEHEAEFLAFGYAAKTLRRILAFASGRSVTGAALAHALGFGEEESMVELASRFGASKQAVHQSKLRLLAIVGPCLPTATRRAPSHTISRPSLPGEWLTQAEAARVAGVNSTMIGNAVKAGALPHTEHNHQFWILEDDVIAWSEARAAAEAAREQAAEARRGRGSHQSAEAAVAAAATMTTTETETTTRRPTEPGDWIRPVHVRAQGVHHRHVTAAIERGELKTTHSPDGRLWVCRASAQQWAASRTQTTTGETTPTEAIAIARQEVGRS